MSNIYCGSKEKIPKGKKLGTMQECADKGQICLYGLKKVDSKIVNKTKKTETKNKLYKLYGRLMGEKNKLTKQISGERDKKKVDELKIKLDDLNNDIKKVKEKLKD